MAIYSRFGSVATIVRVARLGDVKKLEGRNPEKQDREAIKYGSYVVVRLADDPDTERLYHQAYLRADGGSLEISRAIDALLGSGKGAE